MPKIKIARKHTKTETEIREILESIAGSLLTKYNLKGGWDTNVYKVSGTGVTGAFILEKDAINITVDLSLLLAPFKNKIETRIVERLDGLLNE